MSGKIPSKKNRLRGGGNGHFYWDAVWTTFQAAALWELKIQQREQGIWGSQEPISFSIAVRRKSKRIVDLDNSITSVLDLSQKAGIIPNDGLINHYSTCSRTLGDIEDSVEFTFSPSPIPLYCAAPPKK